MSLSASTVIEIRATGDDANGGGFVTGSGGTDYSLQDAAQLSLTDLACNNNTTLTSATGGFTDLMVGNLIQIASGTNFTPSWYHITARADTNTVTLDRNPTTGAAATAGVGKVGGALASPGMAAGLKNICPAGSTVFQKAGTYTIALTTPNVATGIVNLTWNGADAALDCWIGYDATRTIKNTDANRPLIQVAGSGVTSVTLFRVASTTTVCNFFCRNLLFDGLSKTSIKGIEGATNFGSYIYELCEARNCTNNGFMSSGGLSYYLKCISDGHSSQPGFEFGSSPSHCYGCIARNGTSIGFSWANNIALLLIRCIADSNLGATTDGFHAGAGGVGGRLMNCVAYNNGRHGVHFASANARGPVVINSIWYGNAGYGANNSGGSPVVSYKCAGGSNTSGNENAITHSFDFVTLSADPFTDAAGGDFSLNNDAGGGAELRGVAF